MAQLQVEGEELVLRLTVMEKIEGVHGDLRVPMSSVRDVVVLDDAHEPVGVGAGVKVGTRLPGVIEVGTIHGAKKLFAAVHHDTPRGVQVVMEGEPFDEWIVGCEDPESVIASLGIPG